MREIFRRLFQREPVESSHVASDLFDIRHAKTLQAAGLSLVRQNPAGAERLGGKIREFFLHQPELQWRYPLALLPVGQKRFVKWLRGKGRERYGFSDEEILAFLQTTAADLPRHISLTYRINPEWQREFSPDDEAKLIAWLRARFPKYRPLRKVRRLPEIETPSPDKRGVNFLSHFCYPSGLQQAAIGYCASLEMAGFAVARRDVPAGVATELEAREPFLDFENFPVTITNVSPAPHFPQLHKRAGLAFKPDVYRIGYWAWELETAPDEWSDLAASLDEIWTPTPFGREAFRAITDKPIFDLLPGFRIGAIEEIPRSPLGLAPEDCVFLFMFDMLSDFARKNPLGVVRAFRRAFAPGDSAALVIKVARGNLDPGNLARLREETRGAKIILVDETISRAQAYGYIAMCDCAVSLHRSEGFGMLMAEAMALGKPVIATNYSGNTAYMTAENSLPISYQPTTIEDDGPIYRKGNRWAEPSETEAAERMRWVYENRAEAAALGRRAQVAAENLFSLEAAGARMRARLDPLFATGFNRGR